MRVVVSKEQHHFFEKSQYLSLEGLLSSREVEELTQAAEREVLQRSTLSPHDRVEDGSVVFGRNICLTSEAVRKRLFSLRLAEIAYQLTRTNPLRYGFDQLWRAPYIPPACTLDSLSSVTPIVIGVIIALDTRSGAKEELFPLDRGTVAFVSPTLEIVAPKLCRGRFLLFAYAGRKAQYRLQPSDVHTHELKRYGYVFGDLLTESTHPILYD